MIHLEEVQIETRNIYQALKQLSYAAISGVGPNREPPKSQHIKLISLFTAFLLKRYMRKEVHTVKFKECCKTVKCCDKIEHLASQRNQFYLSHQLSAWRLLSSGFAFLSVTERNCISFVFD